MIQSDQELKVTQARIEQFHDWLAQIRQQASGRNFEKMASGYRLEIERMQGEVMDYLMRPAEAIKETQAV